MVTSTQTKMFQDRVKLWTSKQQQDWQKLRDILLSYGGADVVAMPWPDEDILKILSGKEVHIIGDNCQINFQLGKPSQCHQNVIDSWKLRNIQHIHTGYGLSEDGLWRAHSWGLNIDESNADAPPIKTIIETTEERIIYFGYEVV